MLDRAWSWCMASPLHAAVGLLLVGLIGLGINALIRFTTSKRWLDFVAKHPRLAGLFLFLKGAWPEGAVMFRGVVAIFTGELRERALGGAPTPIPIDPKLLDMEALARALFDHLARNAMKKSADPDSTHPPGGT